MLLINKYEAQDGYNIISTSEWRGNTFTPPYDYECATLGQQFYNDSATKTDNVILHVRATSGGLPTGADLCAATISLSGKPTGQQWLEGIPSTRYVLRKGVTYAVFASRSGTGGGTLYQYRDLFAASGGVISSNGGVSWNALPSSATVDYRVYGLNYCTTQAASSITTTTATLNGTIGEADAGYIDERGFDYGLLPGTYTLEVKESGTFSSGAFSLPVTGLSGAVCYWFRTKYHHTVLGWVYAAENVFQALHDNTLSTFENFFQTPSAYNYISSTGWHCQTFTPAAGHQIKSWKFYGYQSGAPSNQYVTVSIRATDGAGKPTGADLCSGIIAASILPASAGYFEVFFGAGTTLTGGTLYAACVRYSTTTTSVIFIGVKSSNPYSSGSWRTSNDSGVNWGSDLGGDEPFTEYGDSGVQTEPPDNLGATSCTGRGYLNTSGGIDQLGFEWGTTEGGPYPNETTYAIAADTGPFGLQITGLTALTPYYYRAKAHHTSYGWLYGSEVEFTTLPPVPLVRTDPPSNVTFSPPVISAVGYITSEGSTTPTIRGFVWGMTSVPTNPGNVAPSASGYDGVTNEEDSFGIGSFTLDIKNLNPGKVYYVRAYAMNSIGYGYGGQIKVIVSDTVNILYPTSDYSKGIRFSTAPGDWYPTGPGAGVTHYDIVQTRDGSLTSPWGYWGLLSGTFVMEKNAYNDNFYTDLYGLVNPIRRTEGVIKIKWKAHLLRNTYPYGEFKRELFTHSTQYTSAETFITPASGMDVCEIFYHNPFTDTEFTLAELDALIAGVSLGHEGGFGIACCDFIEVIALWHNAEAQTMPSRLFTGPTCRLMGLVHEDEGDPCTVYFQYGPTVSYGSETTHVTKSRGDEFYADVSAADLTGYHYRAVITTPCGETFYGSDLIMDYDYGALILEQAYSIAGVRQSIFTEDPTWTDITQYCMHLKTKRGRMHELDRIEAGTAIFTLNNATGNFWRGNTAGAYYPDIKPLTLTRLRYRYEGIYYNLWYGVSEHYRPGWRVDSEGGKTPIIDLECVDLFKSFARYKLRGANPTVITGAYGATSCVVDSVQYLHVGQSVRIYKGSDEQITTITGINEDTSTVSLNNALTHNYDGGNLKKFPKVLSGTRITDCVIELGWPLTLSTIDTGQLYVAEFTPEDTGSNILEHMYDVSEAEGGIVFMNGDGKFIFQDSFARTKSPYNTSQFTMRDDGASSKYVHPSISDDDTFIYNEADFASAADPPLFNEQIVADETLQLEQGPRVIDRTRSQLYDGDDAFNQAFVLVEKFKDSILRCDQLRIKPQAEPLDLIPKVMGSEISTRMTFLLNNTDNPAEMNTQYHIEGIEHEWDASTNLWVTDWQLWNVTKVFACPSTHDGFIGKFGTPAESYLDVHDAPQGQSVQLENDSTNPLKVGQHDFISYFQGFGIHRAVIEFNLASIDPTWTIAKAYMALKINSQTTIFNKQTFKLEIVEALLVTSMPITIDTYGDLLPMLWNNDCGEINIPGESFESYVAFIELNATGIATLQAAAGSLVRFGLRSDRDMDAISPADDKDEWLLIESKAGGFEPRLFIELA